MAAALYYSPFIPTFTSNGLPSPGASLTFYYTGTTTKAPIYSDLGLTVELQNPVTSNSAAKYPNIYLNDAITYAVLTLDKNGAQLGDTIDPYVPGQALKGDKGDTGAPGVTVEQYGGVGYKTAALAKAGHDNRTAFQDAIDALCAIGGGTIWLSSPHYGFAAVERTAVDADIGTTGISGVGLLIDGAHVTLRSTCGGTSIYRRAQDMADPATWANWPLLSGGDGWRGGGVFLVGQVAAPTNYSDRAGVTLDGVTLQGGILASDAPGGGFNLANGKGWDVTDKGIWTDNATTAPSGISTTGDIRIINGGGVIGFRGEVVYASNDPVATLYVRNGTFGESDGQCLNPNSCRVDIDGAYCYNAFKGAEGWLGDRGKLLNATFENISDGTGFGGGKFGAGTFSSFNAPTRIDAAITPYCQVDNLTMKNCGALQLGSWLDCGKITVIDGQVIFSNGAYKDGIIDTHIETLLFITDQDTGCGLIFGGGDGVDTATQSIRNNKIDNLIFQRTKVAQVAGRAPGAPLEWYASLGPNNVVGNLEGDAFAGPATNSAAWSNYGVTVLRSNISAQVVHNAQTTPNMPYLGPRVQVTTTGTSTYLFNLPGTGFDAGAELTLLSTGPGLLCIYGNAATGSNLKNAAGPVFLPADATEVKFRWNGSQWEHLSGGSLTAVVAVADLPVASADWANTKLRVTDSNAALTAGIGAIVAAGGANKVPVNAADEANWRIG